MQTTLNGTKTDGRLVEYFEALKKAKEILDITSGISKTELRAALGVSTVAIRTLSTGGIIDFQSRGKQSKTIWASIEPNVSMAEEWLRRTRDYERKIYEAAKERERTKLNKTTPININEVTATVETVKKPIKIVGFTGKIGFINFTLKPIYK